MMQTSKIGFVDGRSLELAKQWAIEDFVFQLEKRLVERCNIARSAQRSATDELSQKYWEGRADEVGEVILILEDLRRSRGGQL